MSANPVNSSDEHDARCESELVLEAGMYTACDCKARQAHAHHEALSPLAPDCSYGGEASPPRQPSDHDRTVADGHTLTNTLRYACWLRSHDAEVAAAVRAEAVADERRRIAPTLSEIAEMYLYNGDSDRPLNDGYGNLLALADSLASGSVPVATPPAEPACKGFTIRERPDHQPLGPCIHCGKTYQQHRAPSQPVTCEHGQSASHYTTVISGLCPGPVSVPKESSE